jgi:hypothetical protein
MDHGIHTLESYYRGEDPLAARLKELARHPVAALAPFLTLADDLLHDAKRQYNQTAAAVLIRTRGLVVECLEEAVDGNRWISVSEAADRTRRPESTIRSWCRSKKVKARKIGPREWEIDARSLYRYDETI